MLNDGMASPYSEAQQAIQPATSSTSELDHVPTAAQPASASTSGYQQQQQQEQKEPRSARSYDGYEEAERPRRLSSGRRQSSLGYTNAQNHEYPAQPYISPDQDVNMVQSDGGLPSQQVYEAAEQTQAQSQYASTSSQRSAVPPPQPAILQPQQPSSIKQSSQQQQSPSQMHQMHGQPHQYDASTGTRTTSDNFGSVRAGPPSPGKMDLLPWGSSTAEASSSHHARKNPSGSTSHGRPASSSGPRTVPNNTDTHGQSAHHSSSASRYHKSRSQATSNAISGGLTKPTGIPPAFTAQQQQQNAYHEPVAPSSGRSANSKGSSTTSEFTKRKNWSQRIVEEMQDILHVLSPSGTLLFVSPSVTELTGHTPEEMVGHSITEFMEAQDVENFLEEFRFAIMNEQTLTTYYRMKRKPGTSSSAVTGLPKEEMLDGEEEVTEQPPAEVENDVAMAGTPADEATILFEVTGQPYYTSAPPKSSARLRAADEFRMGADSDSDDSNVNELAEDGDEESGESGSGLGAKLCKCFFAMARPYPSKNNATLDTFLELKIENEKLRKKLGDIYREIEGDQSEEPVSPPTATSFQSKAGRPPAYLHGDPTQFELGEAPGERAISGFPSRMSGVFAQQQAKARALDSKQSDQAGNERGGNQQGAPPNSAVPPGILARGGPVDQGDGLVSSAGLIPSTSNTYGALGIGISQHPRQGNAGGAGGNSLSTSKGAGDAAAGDGGADDKKKKPKKQRTEEGEFVCRDCGTVDSPEWRRGPLGPKTLCNACGLRWAKKNKQTQRNSLGGAENLAAAK